jgi:hypothetical protein
MRNHPGLNITSIRSNHRQFSQRSDLSVTAGGVNCPSPVPLPQLSTPVGGVGSDPGAELPGIAGSMPLLPNENQRSLPAGGVIERRFNGTLVVSGRAVRVERQRVRALSPDLRVGGNQPDRPRPADHSQQDYLAVTGRRVGGAKLSGQSGLRGVRRAGGRRPLRSDCGLLRQRHGLGRCETPGDARGLPRLAKNDHLHFFRQFARSALDGAADVTEKAGSENAVCVRPVFGRRRALSDVFLGSDYGGVEFFGV